MLAVSEKAKQVLAYNFCGVVAMCEAAMEQYKTDTLVLEKNVLIPEDGVELETGLELERALVVHAGVLQVESEYFCKEQCCKLLDTCSGDFVKVLGAGTAKQYLACPKLQ